MKDAATKTFLVNLARALFERGEHSSRFQRLPLQTIVTRSLLAFVDAKQAARIARDAAKPRAGRARFLASDLIAIARIMRRGLTLVEASKWLFAKSAPVDLIAMRTNASRTSKLDAHARACMSFGHLFFRYGPTDGVWPGEFERFYAKRDDGTLCIRDEQIKALDERDAHQAVLRTRMDEIRFKLAKALEHERTAA